MKIDGRGHELEVEVVASYPVQGTVRHMDLVAAGVEAYHGLGKLGHRLHTLAAEGEASSLLGDHTLLDTHSHKGIVVEGMAVGIGNHMEEDGSGHA